MDSPTIVKIPSDHNIQNPYPASNAANAPNLNHNSVNLPVHLAARQRTLPVLIIATSTASDSSLLNGLTFTQLLTPFRHVLRGRGPVFRSVGGSFKIENVEVRFCDGVQMEKNSVIASLNSVDDEKLNAAVKEATASSASPIDPKMAVGVGGKEDDIDIDIDITDTDTDRKLILGGEGGLNVKDVILSAVDAPPPSENLLLTLSSPTAPHVRAFTDVLDAQTNFQPHEMFGCPLSLLLVASTSDDDFITKFKELGSHHHLPRPFQNGHYDPNSMKRHYVLLHDNSNGPADFLEEQARHNMKNAFPHNPTTILRINSVQEPNLNQPDLWKESLKNQYDSSDNTKGGVIHRGQHLSGDDILALQGFVERLVEQDLLPSMERRIFSLNQSVTNVKKGLKNMVKSFWRKPNVNNDSKSSPPQSTHKQNPSSVNVSYKFDSIESQVRLLADSLFIMRDFESAVATYRMARDDFKHDKAAVYYASTCEMISLSIYCLNLTSSSSRRELQLALESSLATYNSRADDLLKSNKLSRSPGKHGRDTTTPPILDPIAAKMKPKRVNISTRLATRLALVAASTTHTQSIQFIFAADTLSKSAHHETCLCSAMRFEQAAYNYLKGGLRRKYALHILLAGHMFKSDHPTHALRCFASALSVFKSDKWAHMYDHVLSSLAQQLIDMDEPGLAAVLHSELLSRGGQSLRFQEDLLRLFTFVCGNHQEEVSKVFLDYEGDISLAFIDDNSVEIVAADKNNNNSSSNSSNNSYHNSLIRMEENAMWEKLRSSLDVELRASQLSNDGPDKFLSTYLRCIDDRIEARRYKAGLKYGDAPQIVERAKGEAIFVTFVMMNKLKANIKVRNLKLTALLKGEEGEDGNKGGGVDDENDFEVEEIDQVILQDKSSQSITLRITPKKAGTLTITGAVWSVNDISISHEFKKVGKLLHNTRENRAKNAHAEDRSLISRITEFMPQLEVDLEVVETLLAGEIVEATINLRNIGNADAKTLLVKTNGPYLMLSGDAHGIFGGSATLLQLPVDKLCPGEAKKIKCYFRADGNGRQKLFFLFRYANFENEKHREVEITKEINVVTSIAVTGTVVPSYTKSNDHVMSLTITNLRGDGKIPEESVIKISKIVCLSRFWRVKKVIGGDIRGLKVKVQEAITVHFVLEPIDEVCVVDVLVDGGGGGVDTYHHLPFIFLESAAKNVRSAEEAHLVEKGRTEEEGGAPKSIQEIRRAAQKRAKEEEEKNQPSKTQSSLGVTSSPLGVEAMLKPDLSTINLSIEWVGGGEEAGTNPLAMDSHCGQYHATRIFIRPKKQSSANVCPIQIAPEYRPVLQFQQGKKLLNENFFVNVANRLVDRAVDFELVVSNRDSGNFSLLGPRKFKHTLQPTSSLSLPLTAQFYTPGNFNLQAISCVVDGKTFGFDVDWFVRVVAADEIL